MEKIKLKAWHKILIFSVLGIFIILSVISFYRNKPAAEERLIPVASEFMVSILPYDSCFSMFDNETIKGDSISFETIEGNDQGWIFQIFCAGQKLDYIFTIDVRSSEHVWKKGDVIVIDSDSLKNFANKLKGSINIGFTSNYKTGYNSFLTDNVVFSQYHIRLKCKRYDSLAYFTGNIQVKKEQLDGPGSQNAMLLQGHFRANGIKIGKRIVN